MKHRLERSLLLLRNASVTWKTIAILIAFQLGAFFIHELDSVQRTLGLNRAMFFDGYLFQLFTYVFIHGNWTHLFLNLAAILIIGSKLEHIIPKILMEHIALHAAVAGAVLFLLLSPGNQTLVGASPVCFAYLLMLTTLSPESKFIPFLVSGKSIGIAIILANLILALLNPELPTGPLAELGREIAKRFPGLFDASHACHLGGSLVGWIHGRYMLRPRVSLETLQQRRNR